MDEILKYEKQQYLNVSQEPLKWDKTNKLKPLETTG